MKVGGVAGAKNIFVGFVWGKKEEFPSFRAVVSPILEIGPARLG